MSFMTEIDLVSMMKRDKNPVLNWFLYRSRMRHRKVKVYMRDQGLRRIIHGMNAGRTCFLVPDEDLGAGKHTVFAPFFGQDRATLNTVGRLELQKSRMQWSFRESAASCRKPDTM